MTTRVVVIGAGVGGLAAAARLARRGCRVTIIEARDQPGGLAGSLEVDDLRFDAGPYILLDRLGLEWACAELELDVASLALRRVDQVYELDWQGDERPGVPRGSDHSPIRISASVDETIERLERRWPGVGPRYRRFIDAMETRYRRLQPLQVVSRPGVRDIWRAGAWRDIPFLWRSLRSEMRRAQLPEPLVAALTVWTHVAGQSLAHAPSPLAFVPAVIHRVGAFYPESGIGAIPRALAALAESLGVEFRMATRVTRIVCRSGRAEGVELAPRERPNHDHDSSVRGEFLPADAVVSNVGLSTYSRLLDEDARRSLPAAERERYANLPLQSPGVCAYLAVRGGSPNAPYLRFRIRSEPDGCRLLVTPRSLASGATSSSLDAPARLIAPLDHSRATAMGESGQREFLARILDEPWWRDAFDEVRVVASRIPREWGEQFSLGQDSMNPVMTARFMRAGRIAHRSPWLERLYLVGSATHPGQWVSFCAVSGILAADRLLLDASRNAS